MQKASTEIYQKAAQEQAEASGSSQQEAWQGKPSDDDGTINADYKVKDDKKKDDKKEK